MYNGLIIWSTLFALETSEVSIYINYITSEDLIRGIHLLLTNAFDNIIKLYVYANFLYNLFE